MGNKEKYLLKKQEKEQIRLRKLQQKKIRKAFGLGVSVVLVVVGIVWILVGSLSAEKPEIYAGISKIEIQPLEYDAGIVSMAEGLVKKTFEIKNIGEGDLKIDDMRTSCSCTTAVLKINGEESPKFSMHNNPLFWSEKIAPGEVGYLDVVFDPNYHGPKGTGSIVRVVFLSTNDPENEKVEVKLLANVIK